MSKWRKGLNIRINVVTFVHVKFLSSVRCWGRIGSVVWFYIQIYLVIGISFAFLILI
uniref:Uncharacterized protein n=1 Tax=Arundo donax TaxID=35708 RepID=A0A0A9EL54_ARUDO